MKKLQKKLGEEEKLRMPVAQGLPKTTDEPEVNCSYILIIVIISMFPSEILVSSRSFHMFRLFMGFFFHF